VNEKIRLLLNEAPVDNPETGFLEPSIQPEWAENSELWVAAIKAWAISKPGRRAAKDNPQGWSNVIAYGEAHERRLQQPPASPPASGLPQPGELSAKPFEPAPPRPAQPELSAS